MPYSYDSEEEKQRRQQQQGQPGAPQQGGTAPRSHTLTAPAQPMTFAQMQQQGLPRPPAPMPFQPSAQRFGPAGAGMPQAPYRPTGQLNQGNLEGYLYDMLANPTATPTYKNAMQQIGADIDVDASRRGVAFSTVPVGAYSNAGAGLASAMQGRAYDQLRGYNQDYEQLLMQLLGVA